MKKRKIYTKVAKFFLGSATALGVAISGNAVAGEFTADECLINTKGGVHVKYAKDNHYWFSLGALMQFDQTFFIGSTRDKQNNSFSNGANVRAIVLGMTGGVGEHWSYVMSFDVLGSSVIFDDTYLTYSGFTNNSALSVGRVPGQFFGFDSSNSSSWIPFLEKNLSAIAFYPGDGLGVMGRMWWDNGGVILTAFQPDVGSDTFTGPGQTLSGASLPFPSDRWAATARATYAPVHDECDVYHFGGSFAWHERPSSIDNTPVALVQFRAYPGARGRTTGIGTTYTTARLLDTGNIRASHQWQYNLEFARQWGPVIVDGEYTSAHVKRVGSAQGSLRFSGYNIQGRYLITGEKHEYIVRDGNFCSVTPMSEYGAVELAARYDFLNLNSKDIVGGTQHNATFGVNWYVNNNVRLSANYIRANIQPGVASGSTTNTRNLDIVGLRGQVRF